MANTDPRQDSTGDELADGVAVSGGPAHNDPNIAYWIEDRSGLPDPDSGVDDPVWDGPFPRATFDLGGIYSDLTSIQM